MRCKRLFSLFILVLGLSLGPVSLFAQSGGNNAAVSVENVVPAKEEKKGINITELVFGHVSDMHRWHLFSIPHQNAPATNASMPLPVIVYEAGKGLSIFSSSHFGGDEEWTKMPDGKTAVSPSYEGYHLEMAIKEKVVADDGGKVYDLSVTKNILSMLVGVFLLLWAMTSVAKKYNANNGMVAAPRGFQNFIEVVIIFIRDEVAKPNLGFKYKKFMPLLLTIFFFIWINNMLGLLPGGANFTGNIAVTACLALVAFIVMMANSNKHFWSHLLNPPNVPFLVKCLLVLIEIMSLCIKPVALMIRLFANMLAGHIVILSVICLIFIFALMNVYVGGVFTIIAIPFAIFMFMLELLVAAIQAFIFANLTAVFIGQAIEDTHAHHDNGQAYNVSENEIIA